jgi:tRNA U34 5-methylaminomethyl-2-thiouridine-forming methyltransferase MnmC
LSHKNGNSYFATLRHPKTSEKFSWKVIVGDAGRQGLPDLSSKLDFVWQDPFTPELNPIMWSPEWFAKVRAESKPSTRLMTYSVSRVVKDALEKSGWVHERMRTPGRKRHWLRAQPVF